MEVIHTAIEVSDIEATYAFYVDALGLERHWHFTADDGVENHYVGGDGNAELQFKYDPDGAAPPAPAGIDHLALGVDDVDATVESVVAETGCPVLREPVTLDDLDLRIAFVEDPDGYAVEFVEALD